MKTLRAVYPVLGLNIILILLAATPCASVEVVSTDRHLVKYDNDVVYDAQTGLEWYAGPDQGITWEEAHHWVSELDIEGGGWRMPSLKELETLFHVGDGINNITYLLSNSGYWIWAGRTKASAAKWLFSFSYGGEGWGGQAPPDGGRAVAVRNRK
jgi:hypothetical protein